MKSLIIMILGLAIALWGFHEMWGHSRSALGFAAAKPYYITGGIILFAGMIVNHWEHTRRGR